MIGLSKKRDRRDRIRVWVEDLKKREGRGDKDNS